MWTGPIHEKSIEISGKMFSGHSVFLHWGFNRLLQFCFTVPTAASVFFGIISLAFQLCPAPHLYNLDERPQFMSWACPIRRIMQVRNSTHINDIVRTFNGINLGPYSFRFSKVSLKKLHKKIARAWSTRLFFLVIILSKFSEFYYLFRSL